jgi:CubicO group peptidase (beta-lactamase class C family)
MSQFVAYHGLTAQSHQSRVDDLSARGFRPISLNVSGVPASARYAAVWVQEPGPAWVAVHGLSASDYQTQFDTLTAAGYAPVLVSATGAAEQASFTALFEQGVNRPWFARHGLRWEPETDPDTIQHENNRAFAAGLIPLCLAIYGTPADHRFAGIWIQNQAAVAWSWWLIAPDAYQRFFDALVEAGGRPAGLSVAPDGSLLAVFQDDQIVPWWACHGLTAEEYQAEFDARVDAGLMPLRVQAGGSGADTRYASLFAQTRSPQSRQWTAVGSAILSACSEFPQLDDRVQTFMVQQGIRAGAVAIVRQGELRACRGYTWAEPTYPITQPNSLFRIASLSKLFTTAAIARLVESGQITWDTPAYPFLGITSALLPDQMPDPQIATLTVRQLLLHTSGLVRDANPWEISDRLNLTEPVSRDQILRFMYGEPLAFPPGHQAMYSNLGYILLTALIEQTTGLPYLDYLNQALLHPEGLQDVWVGHTPAQARLPGEVTYDALTVGPSLLQPNTTTMAPTAYGGDFQLEAITGSGGLVTSASTIAQFISRHAVWLSETPTGEILDVRRPAARYGKLAGTTSIAVSKTNGIDFVCLFNRAVSDDAQDDFGKVMEEYLV